MNQHTIRTIRGTIFGAALVSVVFTGAIFGSALVSGVFTGTILGGTISGISRAGLFVRLDETGADGLLPMSRLPADYFRHDESRHALVGERTGYTYHLGDHIQVRLLEVVGIAGQITLGPADTPTSPSRRSSPARRSHRRRP